MNLNSFRKIIVLCVMALSLMSFSVSAIAEDKPLTKADVVEIIKEYIEENPDELLQSIIEKSKSKLKKKQQASLTKYEDLIFSDANSPIAGNAKGDVVVVEFVDYNCGFCKKSANAIASILKSDKDVKVIFKELPVLGEASKNAAKWALAADRQNKYIDFHMALMKNRRPLNTASLIKIAKDVGLDVEKMQKDIKGEIVENQIEKDYNLAVKIGLTGTPVFIIGDELHMGALTSSTLKKKLAAYKKREKK